MMNAALWAVAAFALAVAVLLFVMGWYSPPTNNWLVHPRIFQWGSRAVEYVPGETALDRTYNYSGAVIIVGAGAAGLAAAKVLESNKIKYVILEATERYGGRVKADTTFADFPIDLAAEWIHNLPGILDVLSGRDNAASPPELVPWLLQESCEWDGRSLKTISTFTNNFAFRVFPEYKFKRSTWYRFVRERFAEKVEHRIQYSSPVAEVDYSKGQVTVTTTSGKRFVADKVIMTASVGVLRSGNIRFVPALSAQRTRALDAVEFKPGFKLVLKFSVKFYPDGINWALPSEDDGERGWYDMAFKKDAKSNVLGFLCTGAGTKPYYAMKSDEEIVTAVLNELDKIYDNQASRTFTGDYRLEDWGRKEFTRGMWVVGAETDESTLTEINTPLEDKVYFAGEAHDVNRQMGVPGAILSGLDTVDRLLSHGMRLASGENGCWGGSEQAVGLGESLVGSE